MKPTSNGGGIKLQDIIGLVAYDAADCHKVVEKWFDWQHSRALEVGKWSLAAASGLVAAAIVASIKSAQSGPKIGASQPAHVFDAILAVISNLSTAIALVAGVLLFVGIAALQAASTTQRQYIVAQGLLARLRAIAPFLARAGEQADISG